MEGKHLQIWNHEIIKTMGGTNEWHEQGGMRNVQGGWIYAPGGGRVKRTKWATEGWKQS